MEQHTRWVDSASADDLGSFVPPLHSVEFSKPTAAADALLTVDPTATPTPLPASARAPLRSLDNHMATPKMSPRLTSATAVLPSSPPASPVR